MSPSEASYVFTHVRYRVVRVFGCFSLDEQLFWESATIGVDEERF